MLNELQMLNDIQGIRLEMGIRRKAPSVSLSLNAESHLPSVSAEEIYAGSMLLHFSARETQRKKILDIWEPFSTVLAETPSWTHSS